MGSTNTTESKIPPGTWNWTWICKSIGAGKFKNTIVDLTKVEFHAAKKWIKENKIALSNWELIHFVDAQREKYIFRFKTEEDAMAFKLRWR